MVRKRRLDDDMSRPPPEGEKRLKKQRVSHFRILKNVVPTRWKREGKNGKIIFKKCNHTQNNNKGFEIKRTSTPRPRERPRRSRRRRPKPP